MLYPFLSWKAVTSAAAIAHHLLHNSIICCCWYRCWLSAWIWIFSVEARFGLSFLFAGTLFSFFLKSELLKLQISVNCFFFSLFCQGVPSRSSFILFPLSCPRAHQTLILLRSGLLFPLLFSLLREPISFLHWIIF